MKINKLLLSAAATALLVPNFVSAATDTSTFEVRALVEASCVIDSAADLDFGSLLAGTAASYDAQGDIVWRCTNGTAGTLSLDGGTTAGDITARSLAAAATATDLNYQLYTEAAATNVFGDGTNGNTVGGNGSGMTNTLSTTVFGQILDADLVTVDPDSYADTVTVTLSF